jgi:hypothetical protein
LLTDAEVKAARDRYARDPRRASFFWEAQKDGLIVRAEWDVNGVEHPLKELDGLEPYVFHAKPYRPNAFKAAFIAIEPGMKPIWEHVVNMSMNIFVQGGGVTHTECLLFGREHPDGRQEIMLVLPDGSAHGFDSKDKARAAFWDAMKGPTVYGDPSDLHVGKPQK